MRPPWNPNWDDVRFDHAVVADAVDECRRTARLLEEVGEKEAVAARAAHDGWAGRYRDEFDGALGRLQDRRSDLASDLRRLVERLEAAAEDARLEQQRREDQRDQWYAEMRRLEAVVRAREAAT